MVTIAEAYLESSETTMIELFCKKKLTLLQWRFLSYRNQSIDSQSKSMHWFLYDRDLLHERVNSFLSLSFFAEKLAKTGKKITVKKDRNFPIHEEACSEPS